MPPNFLSSIQNESTEKESNQTNSSETSLSSQLGLVFIDFETIRDTIIEVTDKNLIEDLFHESNRILADTLGLQTSDSSLNNIQSERIAILETICRNRQF